MAVEQPSTHEQEFNELASELLTEGGTSIYLANPPLPLFTEVINQSLTHESLPDIKVFGTKQHLDDLTDDFKLAAEAANLEEDGNLEFRTVDGKALTPIAISTTFTVGFFTVDQTTAPLRTSDIDTVDEYRETCRELWDAAQSYKNRTPPYTTLCDELEDRFNEAVAKDFHQLVLAYQSAMDDGRPELSEVSLAVLLGCKHDLEMYEVGKWCEDTGLTSKATLSRIKSKWEDLGLIEHEKITLDVGRPRLRLTFNNEELYDYSATELIDHLYELEP
jgi:hypothetical protein